jgi:hypothetical protein
MVDGIVGARGKFSLDNYAEQALLEKVESTTSRGPFRDGYFVLEDVKVFDADGRVTEQYDNLEVMADVERSSDGNILEYGQNNAALHCEEKGLFIPSMALSCAILERLFALRDDPQFCKVLAQYSDSGLGWGYHVQNSVVDWESGVVIHYHNASDFTQQGDINSRKRVSLGFDKGRLKSKNLEAALEDESHRRFVQQLTGLQDPKILVKIGEHFERPAHLCVPGEKTSTRKVWLGCSNDSFRIKSGYNFDGCDAFRGVRER